MAANAQLWIQASTVQRPLSILGLSLQSYKWPRRVQVGSAVSDPVFLGRNIVACCTIATTELCALLSISISHHLTALLRVQLEGFVDDRGFGFCGDDGREVRSTMVEPIIELGKVLVEDLQRSLAHDKTLVVASPRAHVTAGCPPQEWSVRRGTWASTSAQELGRQVIYCPWIAARKHNEGRGAPHDSATARAKKGAEVFVAGITPSVIFGVGVTGTSPAHLKQAGSQAATAFGFYGPLHSVDLGTGSHDKHDPVVFRS